MSKVDLDRRSFMKTAGAAAVARRALSIGASVMSVRPRPVGPKPRVDREIEKIDDQVDRHEHHRDQHQVGGHHRDVDELDSVGRTRGTGLGGGHDEREQTLNQILSEMDGFTQTDSVIVVGAGPAMVVLSVATGPLSHVMATLSASAGPLLVLTSTSRSPFTFRTVMLRRIPAIWTWPQSPCGFSRAARSGKL